MRIFRHFAMIPMPASGSPGSEWDAGGGGGDSKKREGEEEGEGKEEEI